jgi:hypothetical protein
MEIRLSFLGYFSSAARPATDTHHGRALGIVSMKKDFLTDTRRQRSYCPRQLRQYHTNKAIFD